MKYDQNPGTASRYIFSMVLICFKIGRRFRQCLFLMGVTCVCAELPALQPESVWGVVFCECPALNIGLQVDGHGAITNARR